MKDCLFLTLLIIFVIKLFQYLLPYLQMNGNFQIHLHQFFDHNFKKCTGYYFEIRLIKLIMEKNMIVF